MPVFKKHKFNKTNEAGEKINFDVTINVNVDGEFYCKLPTEYYEIAENLVFYFRKSKNDYEREISDVKLIAKNNNVFAKTFSQLCGLINFVLDEKLKVEVKKELLIAYDVSHKGGYYVINGKVYPSGYLANADYDHSKDKEGHWSKESEEDYFDKCNKYRIDVFARVVEKITYKSTLSEKDEYQEPDFRENFNYNLMTMDDKPSYGELLNSFTGMSIGRDFSPKRYKYIKYTEENAKFFYDLIIGICNLNERLQTLNDSENIAKMISHHGRGHNLLGLQE